MTNIVKICKKHGELTIENTYTIKPKTKKIILCFICIKENKREWKKNNADRIKLSQEKTKAKRLQELENGTLKKICKTHGDLSIEKIRIDARGTKICRLCSNETKVKSVKKVDPTGEKYRAWLYSDRERVQRYRKNDYPKRVIRQRNRYHRKKHDPEWIENKLSLQRKYSSKDRLNLSDRYINSQLKIIRSGGKNNRFYKYLSGAEFPKEIIDLKRIQINIKRKIKEEINK